MSETKVIERELNQADVNAITEASGGVPEVYAFMMYVCQVYKGLAGTDSKKGQPQDYGLIHFARKFTEKAGTYGLSVYTDGEEFKNGNNDMDRIAKKLCSARLLMTRPRTQSLVWCGLKSKAAGTGTDAAIAILMAKYDAVSAVGSVPVTPPAAASPVAAALSTTAASSKLTPTGQTLVTPAEVPFIVTDAEVSSKREQVLAKRAALAAASNPEPTLETHCVGGCGLTWAACTCLDS